MVLYWVDIAAELLGGWRVVYLDHDTESLQTSCESTALYYSM